MSDQRILLLTASIGSGHIKAAEAIEEEIRKLTPQTKIIKVDFMSKRTSFLHWLMKQIYLKMLALVPNIYDICYKMSGSGTGGSVAQNAFALVMQPVMETLLSRYHPDCVICTHPFPEGAVSLWKRRHHSNLPLAVVMTDYSLHQIWLYPAVDQYYMATAAMKQEMLMKGFAGASLFVTGIPIDTKLVTLPAPKALRQAFGINGDNPCVLLMGGGLGLGGIVATLKILESLNNKLTLLVVAGRNAKLKQKVKELAKVSKHNIMVWGYTDKVHELMKASDLLITKPGALTISEAFALGLPMLLHDPIPGPETENAVYATRNGAAVWLHPRENLAKAVNELLKADNLAIMQKKARKCSQVTAAGQIASQVIKLLK